MDINDIMKTQVKLLDDLGVSHTAMAKDSGINRRTIEAWLEKSDARLQRRNEEKMKIYLRKFKKIIVEGLEFLDNDK